MFTITDKANPNPEVIATELDNEAVLLHLGTKMYFSLNSTGLWIWNKLHEDLNLGEVCQQLQSEFDVSPNKAEHSVLALAEQLHAEKLLDVTHGQ